MSVALFDLHGEGKITITNDAFINQLDMCSM